MKNILPVLTVTALAAAASAQTAPAPAAKQSLSYNRIVASWVSLSNADGDNGAAVFAQAKLGGGLYVSATTTDLKNLGDEADLTTASIGWAYTLPTALGVSTDLNIEVGYKSVGAGLRALIGGGVEIGVAYASGSGSSGDDTFTVSASYNLGFLAKGLSLNASYGSQSGDGTAPFTTPGSTRSFDITTVGIGYNF